MIGAPAGLPGLLLVAACLLTCAQAASPPPPPAPVPPGAAPPPPEQGPAAPWEAGAGAAAGDLAKPALNELVSGAGVQGPPPVGHKDKSRGAAAPAPPSTPPAPAAQPDKPATGAPGDSQSTTTTTQPAPAATGAGRRRTAERHAAERGPRLVSAEQEANAVAARPRPHRGPGAANDAEDADDAGAEAGAGGVTKRPRIRLSLRRNATTTPAPPAPPRLDAAPAAPPPVKDADWKPAAVEDNGLLTTEPPRAGGVARAATPAPAPPTAASTPGAGAAQPVEPAEMMELSSVSPLQRSRLSTLRWRHPERAGADSTTEPPRRIKHRETTWEAPGTTTHRPLVRRGSVRYGAGSTATTAPTSTSTSTGPTPTRSLDEDMRVPETASAWTLASMKGLAPMPMKDETSAAQEKPPSAVLPEGMTFTSALPPIVIEVSTLPDVTPAHAHAVHTVVASAAAPGLELVLNKEPRPAAPGASLDKKAAAASSMMLDAEPHLPLESVFSTGRPAVQSRPVVPAAPAQPLPALSAAANNTGENLVVQPRPEEVIVEVEPAREKPPRKPSATTPPAPAHIAHNAVHAAEEDDEDEDEGATTNAPNIHVVDPPDLATPPVGPAPAAPATTSTTSTTSTSRRPDLWRPVQPEVQPAQPGPTAGPGPAMVEYFTFAPVASSPSASGSGTAVGSAPDTAPDTAPGTASAPSAPSAPSASPSQGPEQDEDVGASSPAPTPFLGEEISVSTMSPEEAEEDARDQDEVLPGVFPVPFGTSTSPRPSVTTATSPTLDLDDDVLDSTTRQPAVPTPPTSTRQTEEPPSSEPTVGGVSTDNTTSSPSTVESTPVTAAPPIPTTRTAPPPPTSPPTAPATAPTVTTMPDLSSSAGPTEAAITTTTSIPMAPLSPGTSAPTTGAPTTTPSAITSTTPTPTPTPTPDVDVPAEETVPTIEDDGETPLPEEAAPEPAAPEPEPEPVPVPEAVPAYLRLLMETDWAQFCQEVEAFRQAAAALMSNGTSTIVKPSQVVLLNVGPTHCSEAADEARAEETTTTEMPSASTNPIANMISIQMYIADAGLHFSRNLTEDFLRFWGCRGLEYPIRKVDLVLPLGGADGGSSGQGSGAGVIAAIAISCVAAACLLVLAALLLIMRKRQKSLRYAQRCTPVSLDAYSLDSVSVCNSSSVRRKGAGAGGRASKRSYGNPAFTDPAAPSHPLTFPALSNMSGDRGSVEAEFSAIPQVAPKADELPDGADTRNRYANVIPLPETRVTLSCKDGDPLSQYINANYVRGPKNADKFYIACQAPLASTVHDFWRMVWETQAKVILMLTDLVEDGVEKCADYLPPSEVTDCHRLFGDFQVTLKKREVKDKYVVSSIQLKNMETNLWREATHMWYMGWPSRGVPDDPSNIIAFLIEARAFMRNPSASSTGAGAGTGARGAPGARQAPRTPPHIVHCSPGTGRTGTVLAIDLCIRDFETTRQVDIPRTVYRLRKDRAGCVQTKEQYMFIYKALNLYATKLTGGALDSI